MQLIQQRRGTLPLKERNHGLDHKDDPSKESPKLLEPVCCSYQLRTLSYLQSEIIRCTYVINQPLSHKNAIVDKRRTKYKLYLEMADGAHMRHLTNFL